MSWDRLENYRVKTGKTWPEVADDIGLGKSMLMMVKTGRRSLSSKALYRLEQAEIKAGIRKAPPRQPLMVQEELVKYPNRPLTLEALRDYMAEEFRKLHREIQELKKGRRP